MRIWHIKVPREVDLEKILMWIISILIKRNFTLVERHNMCKPSSGSPYHFLLNCLMGEIYGLWSSFYVEFNGD